MFCNRLLNSHCFRLQYCSLNGPTYNFNAGRCDWSELWSGFYALFVALSVACPHPAVLDWKFTVVDSRYDWHNEGKRVVAAEMYLA
mmetsp:Transcript_89810/g.155581  ORF Transcript_89810/g.155581 Transcript_89810/m.155581 type:complete len:86 (-) Transcript_89810:407-664(-)